MHALRTRWAAIGAAVAVSIGAGGMSIANAVVDEGSKPIFVPITPCRVMDTRADAQFNTGPRATPLGADETYAVQAAGGTNGDCTTIPAEAVGLVMNVTIIDPTENTFVTVFATGAERAASSNLNALAGKSEPTPNLVTTELSDDGEFSVYNKNGTVDVVADVAGYYEDHNHDDRYFTEEEVTTMIDEIPAPAAPLFVTTNDDGTIRAGSDGITVVRNDPGDYTVSVEADVLPEDATLDDCAINATADQPSDSTLLGVDVEVLRIDDSSVDVTTDLLDVLTDSGLSVTLVCSTPAPADEVPTT